MAIDARLLFNFISGHEATGESAYDIYRSLGYPGDADDFLEFLRSGINGADGKSAYQIWLDAGNSGTEEDFIASLKGVAGKDGIDGKDGVDGKSAYALACEAGYQGTEAEFINKLANTAVSIDKTLSISGEAADAKITGDAISNINKELESCLKEGDTVQVQIATEEQAVEATDDTAVMTPYKTLLAIQEWGGSGGGGGGGGATIPYMTSEFQSGAFAYGEAVAIRYEWGSPNLGKGTLHVLVNDVEYDAVEVRQGTNRYELTGLEKGSYTVQMYVIDRGGQYTDTLKYTIRIGALDITSDFDDSKDFNITSRIRIQVKVDTISLEPIYMNRTIDNETVTLPAVSGVNVFELPTLSAGAHKVKFQATSSVYTSNELSFNIIIADADNLTIISDFNKTEATYRELLDIEYRVSLKGQTKFNAEYYIDDNLVKSLSIGAGKTIWSTRELELGDHILKVKVSTTDGSKIQEYTWTLTVVPTEYTPLEPVIDGSLLAWFDATGKTNMDLDRETWLDKSGNETPITLYNINYGSNGWIDNALKLTGGAYAKIDLQALAENAPYGITVDIKFATRDIGSQNACVMDMRGSDTNGRGFAVDTQYMYLNSSTTKIKSFVLEDAISRATFVIDRAENIAKIYNNGVLSETFLMSGTEEFANNTNIYLGTKLDFVDGTYQPSIYGDCEVYSIRVYERALSGEEIVQNLIADIPDLEEQQQKYNLNYGDTTPAMYFYGDTSAMTKDNKVPLRIKYISTDNAKYGESFDLAACQVSWQGTSSLQYAVKNYKIRLKNDDGSKFKYTPFENGIKESTFCLKADYMESSHANNTGMAKFINNELYDSKFPPQEIDPKVRSTINGFPIHLYIAKDSNSTPEYIGIFNFNLDKSCTDSFGLDNEIEGFENCVSFEVASNSDTSAGAFRDDSDESMRTDFELRYPDPEDISETQVDGYYVKLKRVITWVKNCTEETFKDELEQYFDKEYLLKYFLQAHVFSMVDNLGKNMMFNSWDGQIWYPQFYDLDTQLGLDNTGYVEFYSDVDVEEGSYNTSNSKLWTMVRTVFHDELCEMYKNMRLKRYTVDNIMKYWYGEQVSKIGELQYNKDMDAKYIKFKNDYLFMLHGRRYEHMLRWITERLLYLDTWYGYEENTKQSITIRANKEGDVSLSILTYSPQYLKVKWRNGVEQVLKVGRDANGNMIPTTFSGKLATATDQEVIVYNARHIKTINGLTGLNPSVLNLVEAPKLTEVLCNNSPILADVRLNGENSFIGKIDFSGNTLLAGALDLKAQRNLRYVNLNGTQLSSVLLATNGSNIKELYLDIPTLKSVDVQNMPFLSNMSINITNEHITGPEYSTFKVINCPNVVLSSKWDKIKICSEVVQIESSPKLFSAAKTIGIGIDVNTRLTKLIIKDIVGKNIDTIKIKCANVEDLAPTVSEFTIDCPCNKLQIFGLGFTEPQEYVDINTSKVNYFLMEKYTNIGKFNIASNLKGIHIAHAQNSTDYMPWISVDGGTWTENAGVNFTAATDFETVLIDGVECTDTMDFTSKSTVMNLLHFGDGVLPSSIHTIVLNCDFTTVVEVSGRSRFKLPTDTIVKGNLKSANGAIIWCNATTSSYPPMENLDELNWDLTSVTNFEYLFKYWKNLKSITIKNCNIEQAMYMFLNCEKLESITFENCSFDKTRTFRSMFYGCAKLSSITGFSLHAVLPTKVATAAYNLSASDVSIIDLFRYCESLPNDVMHEIINTIPDIDSPTTDEKKSYSFSGTFYGCTSLTAIPEKICKYGRDLSGTFRMTGVTGEIDMDLPVALNIANILYNTPIEKITKFNAPNAETSNNIFDTCLYLESVEGWSIPKTTNITSIFRTCKSLKTINGLLCPKVTKYDLAFNGCTSLTDIGNINFTQVWKTGLRNSSGDLEMYPNIYTETGNITHAIYNGTGGMYIAYDGLCEKNPLDAESVESLINCLDTVSSATTLKLHPTAYANLTYNLITLASAKNWTLVSV